MTLQQISHIIAEWIYTNKIQYLNIIRKFCKKDIYKTNCLLTVREITDIQQTSTFNISHETWWMQYISAGLPWT